MTWAAYLEAYHRMRPGITEALLDRATGDNGLTPYEHLLEAVPNGPLVVLDLACGSSPLGAQLQARGGYVGIDRSASELEIAHSKLGNLFVRADALALPIADRGVDVVVCSMALMLLEPLPEAVAQISRVLKPGGALVAMYPGIGFPGIGELRTVAAIFGGLLRAPQFPQTLSRAAVERACIPSSLEIVQYRTRRYKIPVETHTDADQIIDGLYVPSVPEQRVERARRLLRQASRRGASVPLHLTHCVAIKEPVL